MDVGLQPVMIKNYIKIALRNFRRHPGHTTVAVAGLAIGLAAFLLITLLIVDELRFDRFHDRAERIHRVVELRYSADQVESRFAQSSRALAETALREIPDVKAAASLIGSDGVGRRTVEFGDRRFYESDFFITDGAIFDVFTFPLVRGEASTALSEPGSAVLTESGARKYFGDTDPVGKTLTMEQFGDLRVTAVAADPPDNSHIQFNLLISLETIRAHEDWIEWMESWRNDRFAVYLELAEGANAEAVSSKLQAITTTHVDPERGVRVPSLQPLSAVHFGSRAIEFEHNHGEGDRAYIYILGAIAVFLVLIGAINYMNMATARSMRRSREVGLRKVVGGRQGQLVGQFLTESVVAATLAVGGAIVLASLLRPSFETFLGRELSVGGSADPVILIVLALVALVVGVISGSYPALYLARFQPAHVLSATSETGRSAAGLRRVLVVTQFAVSIVMIVSTWVVYNQLQYVQTRQLGFNHDRLVVVDINNGDVRRDWKTVRAALADVPSVESVSTTSRVPGDWKDITQIDVRPRSAGDGQLLTMSYIAIDDRFIETFGIDLVDGRPLSDLYGSDSSAVILNETAAEMLGISNADGGPLHVPALEFEGRVVGIVKDFNFQSLHNEIGPLVLGYWNNPIRVIDYFTARVGGNDLTAAIAGMREVHDRFDPGHPFEYNILDQRLGDFYNDDRRMGSLFGISAILGILIACLGLAGLASYTAEQRTKEIGVRKVLGASVQSIIVLMSREFVTLIAVAFVIAAPLAYFIVNQWLDSFAFRADISPIAFVGAGLLTLLIAVTTVSYQSIKSAVANPVDSLRYE